MSGFDRIERRMPELMAELAPASVPDYFDDMLRQTGRARQRPAWASLERWFPMDVIARPTSTQAPALRPILVLLLIGLLVAAGLVLYAGTHRTTLPEPFRNGAIVYGHAGDIYIADQLGGAPRRLTGGYNPVFSPNGDRVAFVRWPSEHFQAMTVRPDGSDLTLLAADLPFQTAQLEWAPSGDALLVYGLGIRDRAAVYSMASDGSNLRVVADGPGAGPAAWRPGSRQIAFLTGDGNAGAGSDAFIGDADGTNVRPLHLDAVRPDWSPAWSPDGMRLSFLSHGDGDDFVHVGVADIDADGGVTRVRQMPLPEQASAGSSPMWSPDGNDLAVLLQRRPQPDRLEASLQVGIFEPDGSGYRLLGPTVRAIGSHRVLWSPDGRSLVIQGDVWTWADGSFGGDRWSVDVQSGQATENTMPVGSWQRLAP